MAFENTARALVEFDKGARAREDAFLGSENAAEFYAAEAEERREMQKVRDAFFEDTKEFNSRSVCDIVGLDFCREMVARDKERKKARGQGEEGPSEKAMGGL
jgi:hypothetical protein